MRSLACLVVLGSIGCGGGGSKGGPGVDAGPPPADMAFAPLSKIAHIIIIVQENHTFDNYFGQYCTAATGSNPTCNDGPSCCEAGPATEPGGASPLVLDDADNGMADRNHFHDCEVQEIDGGKMDQFVTGVGQVGQIPCSSPENFSYAPATLIQPYRDFAAGGALADRYFQPYAGQSSANDMYLARGTFVFEDNDFEPNSIGSNCPVLGDTVPHMDFTGTTVADLLIARGIPWAFYAQGYQAMKDADGACPSPPSDCPFPLESYPCLFDASDVPFEYYASTQDQPGMMRDFDGQFAADLAGGTLPPVSYVKAIGYRTEHPNADVTISAGVAFVQGVVTQIEASPYAADTLVLITWDEGGGFFDHVAPPATSSIDQQPYGTRVPLIAVGPFAKQNYVSHVTMEHSSIIKFIEWNWLDGVTGQLGTRDTEVNNLGDLLDPTKTGTTVPSS